jgi:hypothetical protein
MFEELVTILLGLGIPTKVTSAMHTYQILMDWRNRDDRSRHFALNACPQPAVEISIPKRPDRCWSPSRKNMTFWRPRSTA